MPDIAAPSEKLDRAAIQQLIAEYMNDHPPAGGKPPTDAQVLAVAQPVIESYLASHPAPQGEPGVKGDAGQIFLRQINVTDTAVLAVTLGVVDKSYPCAGAVVGERYLAFIRSYKLNGAANATAGRPVGYYIVAVDCLVVGTINIAHMRPAIALSIPAAKYELFTDIIKVNAT